MKKIVLALSAILVLVSCAQTKQWTDKERTEVKEVVRAHKEKTMLKHMEDNNFANIENCVVTTVEGTYPDYNKYDKLTGKTDTLTSVMINCTTEMLGANYENLPLVFPYPQLQSIGILPGRPDAGSNQRVLHMLHRQGERSLSAAGNLRTGHVVSIRGRPTLSSSCCSNAPRNFRAHPLRQPRNSLSAGKQKERVPRNPLFFTSNSLN